MQSELHAGNLECLSKNVCRVALPAKFAYDDVSDVTTLLLQGGVQGVANLDPPDDSRAHKREQERRWDIGPPEIHPARAIGKDLQVPPEWHAFFVEMQERGNLG